MKSKDVVRALAFVLLTAAALGAILLIGPMDYFAHGAFSEMVEPEQVYPEELSAVSLYWEDYQGSFTVEKEHFTGFQIYLSRTREENSGLVCAEVTDGEGRVVDVATLELSRVEEDGWYIFYTHVPLEKGQTYGLRVYGVGCKSAPWLTLVDMDYMSPEAMPRILPLGADGKPLETGPKLLAVEVEEEPEESGEEEEGPEAGESGAGEPEKGEEEEPGEEEDLPVFTLLTGYAYAKPTFTFVEKVLLCVLIGAVWLLLSALLCRWGRLRRSGCWAAVAVLAGWLLCWNYMFNSFGVNNPEFATFQDDSETLVSSMLLAEEKGLALHEYGLGRYRDINGYYMSYNRSMRTDWAWDEGYARDESKLALPKNVYNERLAQAGNYVEFCNGDRVMVKRVLLDPEYYVLVMDYDRPLLRSKFGPLEEAEFYSPQGVLLEKEMVKAYPSQYGLQGWALRALGRGLEHEEAVSRLQLLCAGLTALVFVAIVALLAVKYDRLLAGCFYATFLFSPWIVNFARNLYWVEFTWFLPMLVGLLCAWKIDKWWVRLPSYAAVFGAVLMKSLCGYEYVSTVMVGAELFLLADFIIVLVKKDKKRALLLLRAMVGVGLAALLGFVVALCIHGQLRGEGDLWEGLRLIYEKDVLRRMDGDPNLFKKESWDSLNASYWETFRQYFHFSTDVVAGLSASFFLLLCLGAAALMAGNVRRREQNWGEVALTATAFAAALSWFLMAKAHSISHLHMNFVLWYFGFVQMCLYIVVKYGFRWLLAWSGERVLQTPAGQPVGEAPADSASRRLAITAPNAPIALGPGTEGEAGLEQGPAAEKREEPSQESPAEKVPAPALTGEGEPEALPVEEPARESAPEEPAEAEEPGAERSPEETVPPEVTGPETPEEASPQAPAESAVGEVLPEEPAGEETQPPEKTPVEELAKIRIQPQVRLSGMLLDRRQGYPMKKQSGKGRKKGKRR